MLAEIQAIFQGVKEKTITGAEALAQIKKLKQRGAAERKQELPNEPGYETGQTLMTREYRYDEPYLKAHVVFGEQVLLGVTHCSQAIEAARNAAILNPGPGDPLIHIHRFLFHQPVVVNPGEKVEVGINVYRREGRTFFRGEYKKETEGENRQTTSGEYIAGADIEPGIIDIKTFQGENPGVVPAEKITGNPLLMRTPVLKTVRKVWVDGEETRGEMELTAETVESTYPYAIHPALLDGGFIIGTAAVPEDRLWPGKGEGMWVPFMIKDIYARGSLTGRCFCRGKVLKIDTNILEMEFTLYDEAGRNRLEVKEFTFKYATPGEFLRKSDPAVEGANLEEEIEKYLERHLQQILGAGRELQTSEYKKKNFMEMGVDSSSLIILSDEIGKELGIELYPTVFFEYQNISDLANYFISRHKEALSEYFNITAGNANARRAIKSFDQTFLKVWPPAGPPEAGKTVHKPAIREEDIAVIGMAGRFARSRNLDEFWENLNAGKDLIEEIPPDHWDWRPWYDENREAPNKTYCKWGSFIEVDKFDPRVFGIPPRQAEWMDPQLRILLEVIYSAIEEAGYGKRIRGTATGVYVGVCLHEYWDEIVRAHIPLVDYQGSNCYHGTLPGVVSYTFDLRGGSIPVDNACASSLTALHLACRALRNGESEMAFAAGVNLLLSPLHYVNFSRAQALSPTGRCHAFDKAADGYVPGEGVGALLLKPLAKAAADNDNIHAIIKGTALNHVGKSNNPTSPRPELQTKVLLKAWEDAGIDPGTITYIEAHGTGTILGDPIEVNALKEAIRPYTARRGYCALGTVKSHLGHLEGAAGIAGVIKTILSMKNKRIPAMPNFKEINPYIKLEETPYYINREPQPWEPPAGEPLRAGVSSFGMSGGNTHVVLESYTPAPRQAGQPAEETHPDRPGVFVLSAANEDRLRAYTAEMVDFLGKTRHPLEDILYTLQEGREEMKERLAVVVTGIDELREKLKRYLEEKTGTGNWQLYRGTGEDEEKKYTPAGGKGENPDHLARMWVTGTGIAWEVLYSAVPRKPRRVTLPTYPFEKERYWGLETVGPGTRNSDTHNAPLEHLEHLENQPVTPDTTKDTHLIAESNSPDSFNRTHHSSFIIHHSIPPQAAGGIKSTGLEPGVPTASAGENRDSLQGKVREELVKIVSRVLKMKEEDIRLEAKISEFGFDSLAVTELCRGLEKLYGLEWKPTGFYEYTTLASMARDLEQRNRDRLTRYYRGKITEDSGEREREPEKKSIPGAGVKTVAVQGNVQGKGTGMVAIIGMSGVMPGARDLAAYWRNLEAGKDCIEEIPSGRWDWREWYGDPAVEANKTDVKWGGFIEDVDKFDAGFFKISPREAEMMDPQHRVFLETVWKAIEDAGYRASDLWGTKTALFAGIAGTDYCEVLYESVSEIQPQMATGISPSLLVNRVSYFFNFHGPSEPVDTSCSSSLVALHRAVESIRSGEAEMAVAGGVNLILVPTGHIALSKGGMLSKDGRCKTFDSRANGYVRGEGCGVLVLKPLERAINEGDHIYGVIKGTAVNHGGHTTSMTAPNPTAQTEVITAAWRRAGVDPGTATYIEAHGTGTSLGDPIEIEALKKAFEQLNREWENPANTGNEGTHGVLDAPGTHGTYHTNDTNGPRNANGTQGIRGTKGAHCGIGSVKTNIGHLESAAGAAGVIKVLLAMKHKTLPRHLHYRELNPYIRLEDSPFRLEEETREWERLKDEKNREIPRRAGVSSFGFGGVNAHVVLEEYEDPAREVQQQERPQIIVISAKNEDRLNAYARELAEFLGGEESGSGKSATAAVREPHPYRQVEQQIAAAVGEILGVSQVHLDPGEALAEYGLDAAGMARLEEEVSRQYRVEVPITFLSMCETLGKLARYVYEKLRPTPGPGGGEPGRRTTGHPEISLANLAYTLQRGREPMEERLAMVVTDLKTLEEKLTGYSRGQNPGEHFYRGSTRKPQTDPGILTGGRAGQEFLRVLIEDKELDKLARLWVTGAEIDWELLWAKPGDHRPKRIALPTYPFARERYWAVKTGGAGKIKVNKETTPPPEQGRTAISTKTEEPWKSEDIKETTPPPEQDQAVLMTAAEEYLKGIISNQVKMDPGKLDPRAGFDEFGLDSILVNEFNTILGRQFGKLPSTLFFKYKTIEGLAGYLLENHRAGVQKLARPQQTGAEPQEVRGREADAKPNPQRRQVIKEEGKGEEDEIAVIGISGRYPMARDIYEYWENLKAGKDCIIEIPRERWDYRTYYDPGKGKIGKMYSKWGGFLEDVEKFDPLFFNISPVEARYMNPQERLFLQEVWGCLEDAGYTRKRLEHSARGDKRGGVGVYVGQTFNEYPLLGTEEFGKGNIVPVNTFTFSAANRVSYFLNLKGPSVTVDTACSSSLFAIYQACESIKRGECFMALAGGVNLTLHPLKYITLCAIQMLSSDGRCRSFCEGGDGMVSAEGVGVVLLKPYRDALDEGDHIYGVIKAAAANHNGRTHGYTVPNPVAQAEVIKTALEKAKVDPRTISYVEAHGTGTALGDPIEITGLTDAYRHYTREKQYCPIGSVKSNIGHAEASAGIAQLTKVMLQLKYKTLVPSLLHSERLNPEIDFENSPFYVQQTLEEWKAPNPRRAGISSFGAGGVNVHLVVEENRDRERNRETRGEKSREESFIIPLSTRSEKNLPVYVEKVKKYLEKQRDHNQEEGITLPDIAYTLQVHREAMPRRIAIAAPTLDRLLEKMDIYLEHPTEGGQLEPGAGKDGGPDALASRWQRGEEVDWRELYTGKTPRLVPLPTYPFLKETCWIPVVPGTPAPGTRGEAGESQAKEAGQGTGSEALMQQLAEAPESERYDLVEGHIRRTAAEVLGFAPRELPDPRQGFFEMGLESIQSMVLIAKVSETFNLTLDPTVLFDYPNIAAFGRYVAGQLKYRQPRQPGSEAKPGTAGIVFLRGVWEADVVDIRQQQHTNGGINSTGLEWEAAGANYLLVFETDPGIGQEITKRLENDPGQQSRVIRVRPGKEYRDLGKGEYEINPAGQEDYRRLVQGLASRAMLPMRVIHSWSWGRTPAEGDEVKTHLEKGYYSLFYFSKALMEQKWSEGVRLLYIYQQNKTAPGETRPLDEAVSAYARTIHRENRKYMYKTLGIQTTQPAEETGSLAEVALEETRANTPFDAEAIEIRRTLGSEEKNRYVHHLEEFSLKEEVEKNRQSRTGTGAASLGLKENGVYLVTGGLGGVGTIFAQYLAGKVKAKLVLCGRSGLTPGKQAMIEKLESLGAEVLYIEADVTRISEVEHLIAETKKRFKRIDGIFHTAGNIRDAFILKKTPAEIEAVIGPKVNGTLNLDKATGSEKLDMFVLFSSISGLFGNLGQCDYSYANRFMDHFARQREERRAAGKRWGRTLSINWPHWESSGGMAVDEQTEKLMEKGFGMRKLQKEEGIDIFNQAITGGITQMGLIKGDIAKIREFFQVREMREIREIRGIPGTTGSNELTGPGDMKESNGPGDMKELTGQGEIEPMNIHRLENTLTGPGEIETMSSDQLEKMLAMEVEQAKKLLGT